MAVRYFCAIVVWAFLLSGKAEIAAFRPKYAVSRSWTVLRDRWEYSHVVRSVFGIISLFLLLIAITR